MRLVERANDLAAVHPDEYSMEIAVIQPDHDYWPLPWYLRKFTRVGYWGAIPEDLSAPLIVASPTLHDDLVEFLGERYTHEMHGLRPAVLRSAYIEKDLWDAFMDGRR
jgi:predicted membrane-bound mannosyltransferase